MRLVHSTDSLSARLRAQAADRRRVFIRAIAFASLTAANLILLFFTAPPSLAFCLVLAAFVISGGVAAAAITDLWNERGDS